MGEKQKIASGFARVFGAQPAPTAPAAGQPAAPTGDIAGLVKQAQQHYDKALEYLKAGDWAGYGKELEALQAVLKQMAEMAGK